MPGALCSSATIVTNPYCESGHGVPFLRRIISAPCIASPATFAYMQNKISSANVSVFKKPTSNEKVSSASVTSGHTCGAWSSGPWLCAWNLPTPTHDFIQSCGGRQKALSLHFRADKNKNKASLAIGLMTCSLLMALLSKQVRLAIRNDHGEAGILIHISVFAVVTHERCTRHYISCKNTNTRGIMNTTSGVRVSICPSWLGGNMRKVMKWRNALFSKCDLPP